MENLQHLSDLLFKLTPLSFHCPGLKFQVVSVVGSLVGTAGSLKLECIHGAHGDDRHQHANKELWTIGHYPLTTNKDNCDVSNDFIVALTIILVSM